MRITQIPERLRCAWHQRRGRRQLPSAAPGGAPESAPSREGGGLRAAVADWRDRVATLRAESAGLGRLTSPFRPTRESRPAARQQQPAPGRRRPAMARGLADRVSGPVNAAAAWLLCHAARLRTELQQRTAGQRYAMARQLRAVPWHQVAAAGREAHRRIRYDREMDHTRTRQQRLAVRSRRLEVAAFGGAVLLCALVAMVAPDHADPRETRATSAQEEPDSADVESHDSALPRSAPVRMGIPELGTDVEVFGAQLDPDGGPPTPDEADAHRAAWHAGGVAPGEPGAALVVGHLDTYDGPAAFAGLGELEPGGTIEVEREDGNTAVFTVDSVEQYPKEDFPDEQVYGGGSSPQLRLITCGGQWTAGGGYDANVVAYASLAGAPGAGSDAAPEGSTAPGTAGDPEDGVEPDSTDSTDGLDGLDGFDDFDEFGDGAEFTEPGQDQFAPSTELTDPEYSDGFDEFHGFDEFDGFDDFGGVRGFSELVRPAGYGAPAQAS